MNIIIMIFTNLDFLLEAICNSVPFHICFQKIHLRTNKVCGCKGLPLILNLGKNRRGESHVKGQGCLSEILKTALKSSLQRTCVVDLA